MRQDMTLTLNTYHLPSFNHISLHASTKVEGHHRLQCFHLVQRKRILEGFYYRKACKFRYLTSLPYIIDQGQPMVTISESR